MKMNPYVWSIYVDLIMNKYVDPIINNPPSYVYINPELVMLDNTLVYVRHEHWDVSNPILQQYWIGERK